jgi:hypothetical protein
VRCKPSSTALGSMTFRMELDKLLDVWRGGFCASAVTVKSACFSHPHRFGRHRHEPEH